MLSFDIFGLGRIMNDKFPGIHALCSRTKMTLICLTVEWISRSDTERDSAIFDKTFREDGNCS